MITANSGFRRKIRKGAAAINPLEYVTVIIYALVTVRVFSFGIYCLRGGRSAAFALVLLLLAAETALFWQYARLSLG